MEKSDRPIHPEAAVAPGYLAHHAARVFDRLVDNHLRPHGLSLSMLAPIMALSWRGPLRQTDLVRIAAIKQPAMAAVLDKLERAGHVVREPSATDRRAAQVRLTDSGARMAIIGGDTLRAANAIATQDLSDEEAQLVVALLQRVIRNLERAGDTGD